MRHFESKLLIFGLLSETETETDTEAEVEFEVEAEAETEKSSMLANFNQPNSC